MVVNGSALLRCAVGACSLVTSGPACRGYTRYLFKLLPPRSQRNPVRGCDVMIVTRLNVNHEFCHGPFPFGISSFTIHASSGWSWCRRCLTFPHALQSKSSVRPLWLLLHHFEAAKGSMGLALESGLFSFLLFASVVVLTLGFLCIKAHNCWCISSADSDERRRRQELQTRRRLPNDLFGVTDDSLARWRNSIVDEPASTTTTHRQLASGDDTGANQHSSLGGDWTRIIRLLNAVRMVRIVNMSTQ